MLEQRRQQYLSLLGVDSYLPRRLLPGAAASSVLTPEQIGGVVQPSPQTITSPAANSEATERIEPVERQQPRVAPLSVLEEASPSTDDRPLKVEVIDDVESEAQPPADALVELNFVLTVWRIQDDLLIIDSREPGAAYPTDRLLQNILRTIGFPLAQLPASDLIRWPVFTQKNNFTKTVSQQNQDREQACAMVQAYITAQMTKLPVKALLCMGENAARFSLNLDTGSDELFGRSVEKNNWDIPVVITPSLFAMLQDPMLKATAWKALQPIVKQ